MQFTTLSPLLTPYESSIALIAILFLASTATVRLWRSLATWFGLSPCGSSATTRVFLTAFTSIGCNFCTGLDRCTGLPLLATLTTAPLTTVSALPRTNLSTTPNFHSFLLLPSSDTMTTSPISTDLPSLPLPLL